ncbi:hypothetical protein KSC_057080 [Ktedonobacter sp. SOSP1-52]|nr:hypothetical protein KSC_057080 [Ktedonobacter sp. SOSP1-52]
MELGLLGWTQSLTFVICGLFLLIAAVGAYQALSPILGKIRSRISLMLMIHFSVKKLSAWRRFLRYDSLDDPAFGQRVTFSNQL